MKPHNIVFSHRKDHSELNGTCISPNLFYVMQVHYCGKKEFDRIRAAKPLGEADTAKATGSDVSVMYFKVKKQQSNSSWEELMPLPHA